MTLSMKKLNCDMYQIVIIFDEEQFRKKEFFLDVKPKTRKQNVFLYDYGSKIKSRKEHAHLFLGLDGKESSLRLTYHQSSEEVEDTREPYLENVAGWIGGFLEVKEVKARVVAAFEYTKRYKPLIQLNYPLLVGSDLYKDAKIVGHDIDFPDSSSIDRANIAVDEKTCRILLFGRSELDLSKFNVHLEIEKTSKFANALVKIEGKDESSERKN